MQGDIKMLFFTKFIKSAGLSDVRWNLSCYSRYLYRFYTVLSEQRA